MSYLGVLGSSLGKKCSYLKYSGLEFALLERLVETIKILKFGTKNAWFEYFSDVIWK